MCSSTGACKGYQQHTIITHLCKCSVSQPFWSRLIINSAWCSSLAVFCSYMKFFTTATTCTGQRHPNVTASQHSCCTQALGLESTSNLRKYSSSIQARWILHGLWLLWLVQPRKLLLQPIGPSTMHISSNSIRIEQWSTIHTMEFKTAALKYSTPANCITTLDHIACTPQQWV